MFPYRVFTLEEANLVVPEVVRLTAGVQEQLDELRRALDENDPETMRRLQAETRAILIRWQQSILELGAEPKGIFTVDFRSPDPNVLWCWTVDEEEVTHRHFTWEQFKDRVSLEPAKVWPSAN